MSYSSRVFSAPAVTRGLQRFTCAACVLFFVVLALLSLPGCVSTERALTHAKENAAYSAAHAKDTALSGEARAIGEVNRISWQVQAFLLGGNKPDPDVIELLPLEFRQEIGLAEAPEAAPGE